MYRHLGTFRWQHTVTGYPRDESGVSADIPPGVRSTLCSYSAITMGSRVRHDLTVPLGLSLRLSSVNVWCAASHETCFSAVSIIPSVLHTRSFIHHQRCVILLTDSVVKQDKIRPYESSLSSAGGNIGLIVGLGRCDLVMGLQVRKLLNFFVSNLSLA
jgi:hypothetical protein